MIGCIISFGRSRTAFIYMYVSFAKHQATRKAPHNEDENVLDILFDRKCTNTYGPRTSIGKGLDLTL